MLLKKVKVDHVIWYYHQYAVLNYIYVVLVKKKQKNIYLGEVKKMYVQVCTFFSQSVCHYYYIILKHPSGKDSEKDDGFIILGLWPSLRIPFDYWDGWKRLLESFSNFLLQNSQMKKNNVLRWTLNKSKWIRRNS